jgi:hypothetical protein
MHRDIQYLVGASVEINRAVHEANYPMEKGDRQPREDYLLKCVTAAINDLTTFQSKLKDMRLINIGSVDDIRSTIQCNWDTLTVKVLKDNLEAAKKYQSNRKSLIKLLESRLKRKQKETKKK